MLINMRNAMMAGKRLPYDAEVEYLATPNATPGQFYIEVPGGEYPGLGIYAKGMRTGDVRGKNVSLIGATIGGTYKAITTTGYLGVSVYGWAGISSVGLMNVILEWYAKDDGTRQISYCKSDNVIVGNTIDRERIDVSSISNFMLINARNNQAQYPACRIYSIVILNFNDIIHDFIPVRFTNELGQAEGAMFDRANPTVGMNPDGSARTDGLYRNRGTGVFGYGNDI